MIVGNMIGGYPVSPKTCVFRDEDGNEIHAVLVDSEKVFTATVNDVREGKTFATGAGVKTGKKVIPAYHTSQGFRIITAGSSINIPNIDPTIDSYDYTKLQAIVCGFNTNVSDSVAAEHVCIDDSVYPVQSTESASAITKDHDAKIIEFGMTNESENMKIIRYFMYKEVP